MWFVEFEVHDDFTYSFEAINE